uniref:ORF7 protein n=1 Tax=Bat Coronavirus MpGD16 TaxID=3018851 RepID=A0AA49EHD7_9NIDO|nr:ORF7 protein [Bat Coronavirus MpGD16]
MFLRKTRTSKSSLNRLMLIWTLLVRTNQRSSANLRKRRRKTLLLNSTLQHLCLHHLLCCLILLLKLSLRWLMRLLMLCLSLLHELSTKTCLFCCLAFLLLLMQHRLVLMTLWPLIMVMAPALICAAFVLQAVLLRWLAMILMLFMPTHFC